MITRVTVSLEQSEYAALLEVAGKELRNPADQLRFVLRKELEQRGLLCAVARIEPVSVAEPQGVRNDAQD